MLLRSSSSFVVRLDSILFAESWPRLSSIPISAKPSIAEPSLLSKTNRNSAHTRLNRILPPPQPGRKATTMVRRDSQHILLQSVFFFFLQCFFVVMRLYTVFVFVATAFAQSPNCPTGQSLVQQAEGFEACTYVDTTGHKTICYGFNLEVQCLLL